MKTTSRPLITPFSTSSQHCLTNNNSLNNSPEFEFWNTNRNNPDPLLFTPLHSADELFSHGFLLPLHFLPTPRSEPDHIEPGSCHEPGPTVDFSEPSALITSDNSILSVSKRWIEMFKRTEKKITGNNNDNSSSSNNGDEIKQEKMKKKRVKNRKTGNGPGSTELNINIWPFTRSRSAGNNSTRSSKPAKSNRKVSSAPCSRSNSSGESKLLRRTCPASPSRTGIHLGRASPVWRAAPPQRRQHLSCRSEEMVRDHGSGRGAVKSNGGNSNLFGFRGLFSKKCTVLTV